MNINRGNNHFDVLFSNISIGQHIRYLTIRKQTTTLQRKPLPSFNVHGKLKGCLATIWPRMRYTFNKKIPYHSSEMLHSLQNAPIFIFSKSCGMTTCKPSTYSGYNLSVLQMFHYNFYLHSLQYIFFYKGYSSSHLSLCVFPMETK